MIARRALLAAPALPAMARAQGAPALVGTLHPRDSPVIPLRLSALKEGMAEAARTSRPVELLPRISDGAPGRLPALAAELAARRVEAIVTVGPGATAAARAASTSIPVVAIDLETDPVAAGWVTSLARPGGNLTGVFFDSADFASKCLQILAEAVPGLDSVGVLWDPSTGPFQRAATGQAGAAMGIALDLRPVNGPAEIAPAMQALAAAGRRALLCLSSPLFAAHVGLTAEAALAARLPMITLFPEIARAGGLLAYGPDLQDLFRRAGATTRRIVEGAKPGELPLERPVRFDLAMNLRTARILGIELPPLLLARASEVIE